MSEGKQIFILVLATFLVAGGIFYSGRAAGLNQGYKAGYKAGEKQMMDDAVQWCAEAMFKMCPNGDANKLRPKMNIQPKKNGSTNT